MFYGLINKDHAWHYATKVCEVLGHGTNNTAVSLLVETACAETHLGEYRDPTERYAGCGLTQVDEGTFNWLRDKFKDRKEAELLKEAFGFTLGKVQYLELELSPLLAFVFCRLRYKTVTKEIPAWLADRAIYWKEFYNSELGKGTPEEYIERAKEYLEQ